jgi:hypothetical protein
MDTEEEKVTEKKNLPPRHRETRSWGKTNTEFFAPSCFKPRWSLVGLSITSWSHRRVSPRVPSTCQISHFGPSFGAIVRGGALSHQLFCAGRVTDALGGQLSLVSPPRRLASVLKRTRLIRDHYSSPHRRPLRDWFGSTNRCAQPSRNLRSSHRSRQRWLLRYSVGNRWRSLRLRGLLKDRARCFARTLLQWPYNLRWPPILGPDSGSIELIGSRC